ncbi:hypothetical protein FOA52_006810 [Chlamydomonas sp. UWO 241]|nr:hypothetical protein FOA52_006810 [Chlamydomonas sp. UWO 241]
MTRVHPLPPPPSGQAEWLPDQILDKYMQEIGYAEQTMLSLKVATESVWKKQVIANGPYETRDKVKNFMVNIGLVSALMLGVTFSSALTPFMSEDPADAMPASVYAVFSGMSLVMSLAVVVVSVIYLVEIDNCVTERDLVDFINSNATIIDMLLGLFCVSVIFIMVAAFSGMWINYGFTEFMIVICVSGFLALLVGVFAAIIAGHNRFRLWVRFDSPLGKDLFEKLRAHESKELARLKQELEFQTRELTNLKDLLELKELKDRMHAAGDDRKSGNGGKGAV